MKMRGGNFVKGMGTGLVIGCAATMLLDPVSDKQRNRLQKKTEGMFRTIGGIIDAAVDMF